MLFFDVIVKFVMFVSFYVSILPRLLLASFDSLSVLFGFFTVLDM